MVETKKTLKAFLCYTLSDRESVQLIYEGIKSKGIDAWFDVENLVAGQRWDIEISKAIYESEIILVFLSNKSVTKEGYVQKEIKKALDITNKGLKKDIILILLEDCKIPYRLKDYYAIKYYQDKNFELLIKTVVKYVQGVDEVEGFGDGFRKKLIIGSSFNKLIYLFFLIMFLLLIVGWFTLKKKRDVVAIASPFTQVAPQLTSGLNTLKPEEYAYIDKYGVSMKLVPSGEFIMGRNLDLPDVAPAHIVFLDAYYIDTYETTLDLYSKCVQDGGCSSGFLEDTRGKDFNFPVSSSTWNMAEEYCLWRGGNLPTEAQWEKAARGIDERIYPWGEGFNCSYANISTDSSVCVAGPVVVGSYELGKSPYGVYDLIGNVREWIRDWYGDYLETQYENPLGPISGNSKVIRGGNWYSSINYVTAYNRDFYFAGNTIASGTGFRCVIDVKNEGVKPNLNQTKTPIKSPTALPPPTSTLTLTPTETSIPSGYIKVPPVIGLKEQSAKEIIASSGLNPAIVYVVRPDMDLGVVAEQDPSPGTSIKLGEDVYLKRTIYAESLLQSTIEKITLLNGVTSYYVYEFDGKYPSVIKLNMLSPKYNSSQINFKILDLDLKPVEYSIMKNGSIWAITYKEVGYAVVSITQNGLDKIDAELSINYQLP